MNRVGAVVWVSGPVVRARLAAPLGIMEMVFVGDERLVGEVIELAADLATLQVYEDTTGLRPGEPVFGSGLPLHVELGPGLLGSIFDGIQRPLETLRARSGDFIGRTTSCPAGGSSGTPSRFCSIVRPVIVLQEPSSRPARRSIFITSGTPPTRWRSVAT